MKGLISSSLMPPALNSCHLKLSTVHYAEPYKARKGGQRRQNMSPSSRSTHNMLLVYTSYHVVSYCIASFYVISYHDM